MSVVSSDFFEQEEHHPSLAHASYNAFFFGPFRVLRNGQPVGEPKWRRNKARALLKWFLLNPGDLFSIEQLSKLFWPENTTKVAVSNLHVTLHYLRHILEPDLLSGSPSAFIRRNRHNYYWFDLNNNWWTDVFEIEHLVASAREAEHRAEFSRATALYAQLMAYYGRTFLPEDIYEDVFSPYRRQHEYAHTQLLEHLMHLYLEANRFDDALSCTLQTLSIDPYNEQAIKTLVRVYLHQGNTTGALRQLDEFQRTLKQELGIEVGKEILTLRATILNSR